MSDIGAGADVAIQVRGLTDLQIAKDYSVRA